MFHVLKKKNFKFINYIFYVKKVNIFLKKKKFFKYFFKKNIFIKFYILLNNLNINIKFFLNTMFIYFKVYWFFYIKITNFKNYYKLLNITFIKYLYLFSNDIELNIYSQNICTYYPNNILNDINFNFTDIKNYNLFYIYNIEKYFYKKLLKNGKNLKNRIIKNKYIIHNIIYKNKNYGISKFKLNFLRVQRRYNKRRYSKVRVSSRNSFFSGISLSSIFLAILWGGSIKNTDWFTAKIIIIDINLLLFLFLFYYIYRVYILLYPSIFIRKKNKIIITNTLHKLFILNIWYKK